MLRVMLGRGEILSEEPDAPEVVLDALRKVFDSHAYLDWAAAGLKSAEIHRLGTMATLPSKQKKEEWEAKYDEPLFISDASLREVVLPEDADNTT